MSSDGLTFGIIGTNFISDWFVAAASQTNGRIVPAAVFSRTTERGHEFADKHSIPEVFSDVRTMCEAVDVVYVASPTIVHHEQAMAAINAGRHVLIEKTMTSTHAQAAEIFEAASSEGVVVMEATRHLHTPAYQAITRAIPRLGRIRYARFEKLQYSSRYEKVLAGETVNAFDPELGNSSLIDLGVYALEPAVDLFGRPLSQTGSSVHLPGGFEVAGSLQLVYEDLLVDVVYSKVLQSQSPSVIHGEAGTLWINDVAETSRVVFHPISGEPEVIFESEPVTPVDTMHHELLAFADQVAAGRTDARWSNVTLAARHIMDQHLLNHTRSA